MPSRHSEQFQFALAAVRSGIPIIGVAHTSLSLCDELAEAFAFGGGGGGAGGRFANTSSFSRVFHAASSVAGVGGAVGSIVIFAGLGTTFGGSGFGLGRVLGAVGSGNVAGSLAKN